MEHNRFKNSFAENIFKLKYAQGPSDSWDALSERLIEDVCGTRWGTDRNLMSESDKQQLCDYIKTQKFIPGGRYLYYAGRPYKAFNNCYLLRCENDTREEWSAVTQRSMACLMTGGGIGVDYCLAVGTPILCADLTWKPVESLVKNQEIIAFDEVTNLQKGLLRTAQVTETAVIESPCFVITTNQGNITASWNHKFVVRKSGNHKKRGAGYQWVMTKDLTENDEIAFSIKPWEQEDNRELGWLGGIFDGEGWLSQSKGKLTCGFAQLPGDVLERGKAILTKYNIAFKVNESNRVHSVILSGKWNILKMLSLAKPIRLLNKAGRFWEGKKLSTNIHRAAIVKSVVSIGVQKVVALETSTNTLIGGGYYSHNTRLRASGKPLSRTGGISSGPIPLMYAINEIGRNVRQGGSRRSAIYASLHHSHEDAPSFLKTKNWGDQQIGKAVKADGTPYTFADAKHEDFNFNAPLDMTNISINWDEDACGTYLHSEYGFDSKVGFTNRFNTDKLVENPLFIENCKQAMSTGEPGFSFNFGAKKNETLRNACTEVTSEDDSDVLKESTLH